MFNFFQKRPLGPRATAIKDGLLIDMQVKPFKQFNQIVQSDLPIAMTKASFTQFIRLPGDPKKYKDVSPGSRWIVLYSTLINFKDGLQQLEESKELLFDVDVQLPGGFQLRKTVKVVLGEDDEGGEAFTFMLPSEELASILRVA